MSNLLDFMGEEAPQIETSNDPVVEWKDMPEFVSEKVEAYSKIIVRFDNEDDLQEFAKMIGQKLTNKTKSIWHPQLDRGSNAGLRYVDK